MTARLSGLESAAKSARHVMPGLDPRLSCLEKTTATTTYVMAVLDTAIHDWSRAPALKSVRDLARRQCVRHRVDGHVKHGHDGMKRKSGKPDSSELDPAVHAAQPASAGASVAVRAANSARWRGVDHRIESGDDMLNAACPAPGSRRTSAVIDDYAPIMDSDSALASWWSFTKTALAAAAPGAGSGSTAAIYQCEPGRTVAVFAPVEHPASVEREAMRLAQR